MGARQWLCTPATVTASSFSVCSVEFSGLDFVFVCDGWLLLFLALIFVASYREQNVNNNNTWQTACTLLRENILKYKSKVSITNNKSELQIKCILKWISSQELVEGKPGLECNTLQTRHPSASTWLSIREGFKKKLISLTNKVCNGK